MDQPAANSDERRPPSRTDICFVIGPIGDENSDTRKRANDIFDHLVTPVANELGLTPERADRIQRGGLITDQIIDHLIDDKIVVADCHGWNANVFYELSVRHVTGRPVIHLIAPNEPMPFDAYDARAIPLDIHDLHSAMSARDAMKQQMQEMLEPGYQQLTPIGRAAVLRQLLNAEPTPRPDLAFSLAVIAKEISQINSRLASTEVHERPALIPGLPASIALTASPAVVPADGMSTSTVTALVTDAFGASIPDGEQVVWSVPANAFLSHSVSLLMAGTATVSVTPFRSSKPGRVVVQCLVPRTRIVATIAVDFTGA